MNSSTINFGNLTVDRVSCVIQLQTIDSNFWERRVPVPNHNPHPVDLSSLTELNSEQRTGPGERDLEKISEELTKRSSTPSSRKATLGKHLGRPEFKPVGTLPPLVTISVQDTLKQGLRREGGGRLELPRFYRPRRGSRKVTSSPLGSSTSLV